MIEIRNEEYTAYAVAQLINRVLDEENYDRQIPTQMMYNYTRNGLIAKRTKGESSKNVRYTPAEVVAFVNKWFAKNYKTDDVVTTNAVEIVDPFAQFSGTDKVSLVRK